MPAESPGLLLSKKFYAGHVAPALASSYPRLPHGAGLMGRGSEVLGYDDAMSTDHDWTARVIVFVPDDARTEHGDAVHSRLTAEVPATLDGAPTAIVVTSVPDYFQRELELDVASDWDAYDWLSLPEQRLCALTAGAVFHDEVGLTGVRQRLAYYPHDVWLYLLSAGWWRVHPELNLVGRTGYVGDELGSTVITAEMVAGLVHLAFLVERRYAPYAKWRGTAFARLPIAARLAPALQQALRATDWPERERALAEAYAVLFAATDDLGLVPPPTLEPVRMWDRPFAVPWADFPTALHAAVTDPAVQGLCRRWPTGFVDQLRDLLWEPGSRLLVRRLLRDSVGPSR